MPTWLHRVNYGYTDSPTANMVEHSKGLAARALQRLGDRDSPKARWQGLFKGSVAGALQRLGGRGTPKLCSRDSPKARLGKRNVQESLVLQVRSSRLRRAKANTLSEVM